MPKKVNVTNTKNVPKHYITINDVLVKIFKYIYQNAEINYTKDKYVTKNHNYLRYDGFINNYKIAKLRNHIYNCMVRLKNIPKINHNIYNNQYMYVFVTPLMDPENKNRVIIKIGFTENLIDRQKSIESEIGEKIYLLGYRIINGQFEERIFHSFLKENYSSSCCLLYKNMKNKVDKEIKLTEYYYMDKNVLEEYCSYEIHQSHILELEQEKTKQMQIQLQLEQEKTEQFKYQEQTKQEQEKTKQMELQLEQEKTKQLQLKLQLEPEKTKQLELQLKLEKISKTKNKKDKETSIKNSPKKITPKKVSIKKSKKGVSKKTTI